MVTSLSSRSGWSDCKRSPASIGSLTNLIKLDLTDNHLTGVPPEIGKLTNLSELEPGLQPATQPA
jgi:Leucine-rich repeat (LRR) protein